MRALKVSGGRYEAALDYLAKQQQCDLSNGCSKASSGIFILLPTIYKYPRKYRIFIMSMCYVLAKNMYIIILQDYAMVVN